MTREEVTQLVIASKLPEIGTQSVVSEVLTGRRLLNVRQITALAKRFELPADVFLK